MKEWLYRALRTFAQSAVGFLTANLVGTISDLQPDDAIGWKLALIGLITSSVAAGLAAVMNLNREESK